MNSILNLEYILYLSVSTWQGNLVVEMRAGHSDPDEELGWSDMPWLLLR